MAHRQRILILGARGRLGGTLVTRLGGTHAVAARGRVEMDLASADFREALSREAFEVLINCAAVTSLEACESEPALAWRVNAEAPGEMAALCQQRGARLIHISTDYVFAGNGRAPLTEEDAAEPGSVYGRSKLGGERAVLAACPPTWVGRVSWLFGGDKPSFPDMILRQARDGGPVAAITDKWSTPTSTGDLAAWIEALVSDHPGAGGVLHLCNSGVATWQEYAQATVDLAVEVGLLEKRVVVEGQALADFTAFKAARPRYTPMANGLLTERTGIVPRSWQAALRDYLELLRQREVLSAAI